MMNSKLQEAMEQYGEYCIRVAYLYVKDWTAAEEIVQDVFLAYHFQQERFRNESSLKTYLVKITIHKSHDYLRSWSAKKRQFVESFHLRTAERSSEYVVMVENERQILLEALWKLPLKYREVLILHYYDDYKIKEMAEIIGISENTVKTRISRGRTKLKELLEPEQWEVLLYD